MTCISQKAKNVEIANQSLFSYNKSWKVNDAKPILSIVTIFTNRGQKVDDIEFCAKDAMKKTCTDCIIKLFAKVKDMKAVLSNL